jgi:transglutaminase-like putative cysteine protease
MSWLRIIHETTYSYKAAVRFGPHRLVLRPREGHDIRVEKMRLEIVPKFELEWSRDLFGNSVATVHFLSPSDHLIIRSEVLLQQTVPFPLRSERPSTFVPFPVAFSGLESSIAAAYQATTFPADVAQVREWVRDAIDLTTLCGAEDAMDSVGRAIHKSIKYRRRVAKGVQRPTETLAESSGSCRDMATLMLEALRTLGLPARFASGYLDCAASEAGRASTHAWAEAYLPHIGWTGYDPMLGEATSHKHVVTGVSNHPRGVMPVSGTFFDEHNSYVGMTVTVQTQRLGEEHNFSTISFEGASPERLPQREWPDPKKGRRDIAGVLLKK